MNEYLEKYLKYKNKYNKLKMVKIGGAHPNSLYHGSYTYEKSSISDKKVSIDTIIKDTYTIENALNVIFNSSDDIEEIKKDMPNIDSMVNLFNFIIHHSTETVYVNPYGFMEWFTGLDLNNNPIESFLVNGKHHSNDGSRSAGKPAEILLLHKNNTWTILSLTDVNDTPSPPSSN
jgi:hypothetical protein